MSNMQDVKGGNPEVGFQKRFFEIFEIYKRFSLRSVEGSSRKMVELDIMTQGEADKALSDREIKFKEMSESEKVNEMLNNFWMYLPEGGYREMFDMSREYLDEDEEDPDLLNGYKILDQLKAVVNELDLNEQVAGIVEYKRSKEKSDSYDEKLANRVMLDILFKMIDKGWDFMKLRK